MNASRARKPIQMPPFARPVVLYVIEEAPGGGPPRRQLGGAIGKQLGTFCEVEIESVLHEISGGNRDGAKCQSEEDFS